MFQGQSRDVFHKLPTIRQVYRTTDKGQNSVLFGVQAGDVHEYQSGFHKGMFAPLKATGLYFHAKENEANSAFRVCTLQMRSCFQLGLPEDPTALWKGCSWQDVGRCMDVIEGAGMSVRFRIMFLLLRLLPTFLTLFCY